MTVPIPVGPASYGWPRPTPLNSFPTGAARIVDFTYPQFSRIWSGTNSNTQSRNIVVAGANCSNSVTGAGSISAAADVFGRDCVVLNGGAAGVGNMAIVNINDMGLHSTFGLAGRSANFWDDFACAQIDFIALYGVPGSGLYVGDNGLEVQQAAGVVRRMVDGGSICGGFGFKTTALNEMSLITRVNSAGGLVSQVIANAAAGYDMTIANKFSFRILSATKGAPAILKVLWNDLQVGQLDWGPGSILPNTNGTEGRVGLIPSLVASNASFHYCAQVRLRIGPTEASLL